MNILFLKTNNLLLIFIAIFHLSITCCHSQEIPDGGPCSYTTTNYPATIIDIFEVYEGWNEIFFLVKTLEPADTTTWSREFSGYISDEELKTERFKAGDTLAYEIREIIDGNCSPYLKRLTKERYKK